VEVKRWFGVEVPWFTTGEEVVLTVAAKILEPGLAAYARENKNYVLLCGGKSWAPTVTVADMCGTNSVSGCMIALHVLVKGGAPNGADEEDVAELRSRIAKMTVKDLENLGITYLKGVAQRLKVKKYTNMVLEALAKAVRERARAATGFTGYFAAKPAVKRGRDTDVAGSAAVEQESLQTPKRPSHDTVAVNDKTRGPDAATPTIGVSSEATGTAHSQVSELGRC
jgi:hypothetical protein